MEGWSLLKHRLAVALIIAISLVYLLPIVWIGVTSIKPRELMTKPDVIAFKPTLEHYERLWIVKAGRGETERVVGRSDYPRHFSNSLIITALSTLLAVTLGTLAAYAFSRFKVKGKTDLMFFILSTRMLPPVAVAIPIYLMYTKFLGWYDTRIGLIVLYTVFNLSFAVWLMKGFIDEIPKDYEEAAMVDRLSRFKAFIKVVLPQSVTGLAATAVFCAISAWNEFAFALFLTQDKARTAPPSIPSAIGTAGIEWGQIAAGTFLFLLPVALFTFIMRNHLLRGITFGAIKR
ncbi:MAG: carbohydrate ABC transporter permease [Armatimonadetes bacterium]|nr:carbohydrate ABC transporter permease [Armatimonadota bacterium]